MREIRGFRYKGSEDFCIGNFVTSDNSYVFNIQHPMVLKFEPVEGSEKGQMSLRFIPMIPAFFTDTMVIRKEDLGELYTPQNKLLEEYERLVFRVVTPSTIITPKLVK